MPGTPMRETEWGNDEWKEHAAMYAELSRPLAEREAAQSRYRASQRAAGLRDPLEAYMERVRALLVPETLTPERKEDA